MLFKHPFKHFYWLHLPGKGLNMCLNVCLNSSGTRAWTSEQAKPLRT